MRELLPINLSILKQLREELNLSIFDVAYKMNKEPEVIESWESGGGSPTYIQLEILAQKVYKKPIAVFFMPNLPYSVDPDTDFRSMPDELNKSLPASMIYLYRKAKAMQLNLMELYDINNHMQEFLNSFSTAGKMSIAEICEILRSHLDVSLNEQIQWKNADLALKNWRKSLENIGITIFKDAFRNDDYSGFCLYDENYPLIYLNNSMPKTRQIFTLFHEIGHLIYRNGGIDINDKLIFNRYNITFNQIEIKCNKLANEFLLPDLAFSAEDLPFSESNVEILATKFSVSRELVLRKYLDYNLIDEKIYTSVMSSLT